MAYLIVFRHYFHEFYRVFEIINIILTLMISNSGFSILSYVEILYNIGLSSVAE